MATFTYKGSGDEASTTSSLSRSPNYPSGSVTPAVGEPLFLVCRGNTNGTAFTWTPPSDWTEIGAAARRTDAAGYKNAIQVFWKIHDTGTSVTVTTSTSGIFGWGATVLCYTGTGTPALVGTAADETTAAATTFQPAAYTAAADSTVVSLVGGAGTGGSLTYSTANGFTRRTVGTSAPAWAWGDQDVSAGSVTMPAFSSAVSNPWLSKTFALARQQSGWSVGRIKF